MTKQEKIKLLEDWQKSYIKLDKSFEKLSDALGCYVCESEIFDSSFAMFDNYTKLIAILLDSNNVGDWLEWYCYDNEMGKKQMEARAGTWKKARKIKTVKDLIDIIEA